MTALRAAVALDAGEGKSTQGKNKKINLRTWFFFPYTSEPPLRSTQVRGISKRY